MDKFSGSNKSCTRYLVNSMRSQLADMKEEPGSVEKGEMSMLIKNHAKMLRNSIFYL